MFRSLGFALLVLVVSPTLQQGIVAADAPSVSVTERFGVDHPEQIVELPLVKPIPSGSWSAQDDHGHLLPVQILTGGQRLALQTDLPAHATRNWSLVSKSTPTPNPVTLRTNSGLLEIANRLIAVRIPLSNVLSRPFAAPLVGLRWKSGEWMGGAMPQISFAGGSAALVSFGTRIVEAGPLLVIAEVTYRLGRPELRYGDTVLAPKGAGEYRARFRLEADQPSVMITEETDTPFAWSLALPGLHLNQARYRGHHSTEKRWGVEPDGRQYRPAHERPQLDASMEIPFDRDYVPGEHADSARGTFRRLPAWDPWIFNGGWYWQFFAQDGGPDSPLLGLFAGRPSLARDVGDAGAGLVISSSNRVVGIGSSAQLRSASGQLQPHPRFQWGIFAGTRADLTPSGEVQMIARQMNLHAGFNLTKLSEIPFDFPDPPQRYGSPFMPRPAVDHLRESLRADVHDSNGSTPIDLAVRKDPSSRELIEFWGRPSPEAAGRIVNQAALLARDLVHALVHEDGIYNFRFHYWLGGLQFSRMLLWIDQVLGSDLPDPQQRAQLKSIAALFASVLWDEDFVPLNDHRGINLGTPNMPVQQAGYRDQYALLLLGLPEMRERARSAVERVARNLEADILPNGAHLASVHYIGASMGPTLTLLQQFQQCGLRDFFQDEPRLESFAEFLMQCATPAEPRFGGLRKQIAVGDSATESSELFGQLGTAFASSNPVLSRRLMGMWRAQGSVHSSFHGTTLLKIDESLPGTPPVLPGASFPGYFSVLRSGEGTSESAAWMLTGNHYRDHSHDDEGECVLYASGAPLSVDWGSMYEPRSSEAWMHNLALPEPSFGWLWGAESPLADSHARWGNYAGTKTTLEEFQAHRDCGWIRSRMQAPDKSFTWTRALTLLSLNTNITLIALQDGFTGPQALGEKIFSLNLCATGEVRTPRGPLNPPERFRGYGDNDPERREQPSFGSPISLEAGVSRFDFTGQFWPKHPAGGIDFSVFLLADEPRDAAVGHWGHAWAPGTDSEQFRRANQAPFEERQHILRLRGQSFRVIIVSWPKSRPPRDLNATLDQGEIRVQVDGMQGHFESSGKFRLN